MGISYRAPGGLRWWVNTFTSLFLAMFCGSPFLIAKWGLGLDLSQSGTWAPCLAVALLLGGALWFAERRCGSPRLSVRRGLMAVTSATSTNNSLTTFVTVFPSLLLTVLAVIFISFTSSKQDAEQRFVRIVGWFVKNRVEKP